MSLMKREPSPAQSLASRANSLRSTGPRSERGKSHSGRNLQRPRLFSQVVAASMEALGESPTDFEQTHEALAEAMEPRDAWEAAWVEDIAILRWRVQHLHRAEAGALAVRRRQSVNQRRRAACPPTGSAAVEANALAGHWGFTGIPDSAMKFKQVIAILTQLRDTVTAEIFEEEDLDLYFSLLYGQASGPHAALLRSRFARVAEKCKQRESEASAEARRSLVDEMNKEIANWEQLQALYAAEYLEADPLQQDAALLLPSREMDEIIRYETHLENQIERKLRQFYARRREPVPRDEDSSCEALERPEAGELDGGTGTAGA